MTLGFFRDELENVVLVNRETLKKHNLFEKPAHIDSFFVLRPSELKEHSELS
jgi:hypothetical protein